jgi:phosphonate transport system ATP-binding protein
MLALSDVSRSFGATMAVDHVSLRIARGEMVGVIGRSGAGKSTLLRLVNRLVEAQSGRITWHDVDGRDVDVGALRGAALRRWRARCAMIFQQFNLSGRLDVLTNVLIGRIAEAGTLPVMFKHFSAAERTMAAIALERLDLLPQALQRADTLSGGQQQRVAIARVLVQRPEIVLADEPIASLDRHNAAVVMDALRAINREDGITVLCNLHTLDVARDYCDRIIGLARGQVVFDGPPAGLTEDCLTRIYGAPDAARRDGDRPPVRKLPARAALVPGL